MADPTRPVAGAPIDTDWGQQIHDRVFQPKGLRCHNAGTQSIGGTFEQLQIDIVDDDPGGWLDDDKYVVPTGYAGLYAWWLTCSVDGSDGEYIRLEIRVNGTAVPPSQRFITDSAAIMVCLSGLMELTAGDEIDVWARYSASSAVTVIRQFDFLIQGTSIGA